MEKYALSLTAQRSSYGKVDLKSCAAVVEASSEYEAVGLGVDLAKKRWPNEAGWVNHACATCLIEDF